MTGFSASSRDNRLGGREKIGGVLIKIPVSLYFFFFFYSSLVALLFTLVPLILTDCQEQVILYISHSQEW